MKNFLTANPGLKVLSLIFALIAWYYVIIVVNPTVIRVFKINLDTYDARLDYDYRGIPKRVDVEVVGRRLDLIQLFKSPPYPVQAYVDLHGIDGVTDIYVKTKKLVSFENFTISGPKPRKIHVEAVKLQEREIRPKYTVLGSPRSGYMRGDPSITPDRVRVLGTQEALERLRFVMATFDISGATHEITGQVPLTLLDARGEAIGGMKILPEPKVKLTVPIWKWPEKKVAVRTPIIGKEPPGYEFVSARAEPVEVTVRGLASDLASLENLVLDPVDITGITNEKIIKAKYGFEASNLQVIGEPGIIVKIIVRPVIGELVLPDIPVRVTNVPSNSNYDPVPPVVSVTVEGMKIFLLGVTSEGARAVIDARKAVPGTMVTPEVHIPGLPRGMRIKAVDKVKLEGGTK